MSRLFDQEEDETPLSIGSEVGGAVAEAISKIGKSNEAMAKMVARSIAESLNRPEAPPVAERPIVTGWKFKVIRDKDGNMNDVLATAIFGKVA